VSQVDEELRTFVRLLESLGLRYAVMGGIAVRAHGIPRPTQDVDFTVAIERRRLPELYDAARRLGYDVPEAYQAGWVDQVAGMPLVRVGRYIEGNRIDVDLFLAESRFQNELLARARPEQIDDITVHVVSPEDLVLLKLLAHRPRDIADIGDILFVQGSLDEAYLRQWAGELGVSRRLEDALADPPPA
jgi:predicted nucleotidyltransferase